MLFLLDITLYAIFTLEAMRIEPLLYFIYVQLHTSPLEAKVTVSYKISILPLQLTETTLFGC